MIPTKKRPGIGWLRGILSNWFGGSRVPIPLRQSPAIFVFGSLGFFL